MAPDFSPQNTMPMKSRKLQKKFLLIKLVYNNKAEEKGGVFYTAFKHSLLSDPKCCLK